jgi:hypothetical protein
MHFALPPGATTMVRNLATSAWWGFPYPGLWLPAITNSGARAWRPLSRGGMLFAMADAIGLESLRWKRLAILSVAQFRVVLDASIANVALGA